MINKPLRCLAEKFLLVLETLRSHCRLWKPLDMPDKASQIGRANF